MSLMFMSMLIIMVFLTISYLNFKNYNYTQKMYSFECGFDPFSSPRLPFSIQFFKIMLIFLLFDMEIMIILPLPLFNYMNTFSTLMIMLILMLLLFGLYFEWKEGSLNWLK